MISRNTSRRIEIDIGRQRLSLLNHDTVIKQCLISSAANGVGQQNNSGCTPLGEHFIRAKIGEGLPVNTVFRGRRPTGEIYQMGMRDAFPDRDWILTRILWLCGSQPGYNRLGEVDTMRRYIYIHGAPEEVEMGKIGSKGCIRMRNHDLLDVFENVKPGCKVTIHE